MSSASTTVFSSHRVSILPSVRPAVLALLALLLLANVPQSEANMRLCGSKLTKTLLAVCSGQLCGAYVDSPKRSVIPAILSVVPLSDPEYYEVHRTVKREAGLATECCTNRCSYSHLKKYCCMN
ncbi:ins-1 [Pristionchus pacificus]|uniref:Ins-1 n=1 Tax=Pristionchus pacificus TaxID=54126 RepID=A0A2A6CAW0_PRIPA|nr:ins-1 [Pristionchus pacificus]|eukprot:PDM75324.1 ins-1 [Pristionchus pacificus]